jgi:hypothetical protein
MENPVAMMADSIVKIADEFVMKDDAIALSTAAATR